MFEDSTFESAGKIHTRSRGWMIATFAFNSAILLALIVIPLVYPEALPRFTTILLMTAPAPPPPDVKPIPRPERATVVPTEMPDGFIHAPSRIPKGWTTSTGPEVAVNPMWSGLGPDWNGTASPDNIYGGHNAQPSVRQAVKPTQHVSSGVMTGYLIYKVVPKYPAIALAAHLSGRVVLQATISKNGSIENLHVLSGQPMLQQAAIDAVGQWRYRPYLLNGDPVEVETAVIVDFTLN